MNMGKRCLQSRPRGPAPKISPARKGWVHQAVERRRCGTLRLFIRTKAEGANAIFRRPHSSLSASRLPHHHSNICNSAAGTRKYKEPSWLS